MQLLELLGQLGLSQKEIKSPIVVAVGKVLADVPSLLTQMQQTAVALSEMARSGFRLDKETVRELAREDARRKRWGRVALWIGALSLAVLAATSLGWLR